MRIVRLVKGFGTVAASTEYALAAKDAKVIYQAQPGDFPDQFIIDRYEYHNTASDGIDVFCHTGRSLSADPFLEFSSEQEPPNESDRPKIPSF